MLTLVKDLAESIAPALVQPTVHLHKTEPMSDDTFTPLIFDLGSKSKSSISKLKKGEGKLMEEIEFTFNSVKQQLDVNDEKEIIPMIILYKEKVKDKIPFPFPRI